MTQSSASRVADAGAPGPCRRAAPCRRRTCTRRRRRVKSRSTSATRPVSPRRDAVAGGRAEHVGVVRVDRCAMAHRRARASARLARIARSAPASRRGVTVFVSPGSKRTAVPAGMSRRMPSARARSNVERAVGLGERIVAADLDRAVAAVRDGERRRVARPALSSISPGATRTSPGADALAADVAANERRGGHGEEAAVEREREIAVVERDRMVHGDELGAVGERALDLDLVRSSRRRRPCTWRRPRMRRPEVHQLGDAIARRG